MTGQSTEPQLSSRLAAWQHAWRQWRQNLKAAWPTVTLAVRLFRDADGIDRAAALTLFTLFAAVPSLFVAFSVLGFLLTAVELGTGVASELALADVAVQRVAGWLRDALPGVTWDPSAFVLTLIRHRTLHAGIGTVLAIFLALSVFSRLDAAVRAMFGKSPRSALRAAGFASLLVLVAALAAMLVAVFTPLLEWGSHLAGRGGVLAWLRDGGMALLLTAGQILPVASLFALQVRWSVRGLDRRRLWWTALCFGGVWFVGQRLFAWYVLGVVQMDAVYGTLSGVIALMLWVYYANVGGLFAVALLAAWEKRALPPPPAGAERM
jgi:membrane protein